MKVLRLRKSPWPRLLLICVLFPPLALAKQEPVHVHVRRAEGGADVHAELRLPYPASLVCGVMTDYDHMADFVPNVRRSRVVHRSDHRQAVDWRGSSHFLIFSMPVNLLLDVHFLPGDELRFRSLEGNVKLSGSVRFVPDAQGTRVDYRALLVPDFGVPPLVGPPLVRRQIQAQFEGMVAEMGRRAATGQDSADPWCRALDHERPPGGE